MSEAFSSAFAFMETPFLFSITFLLDFSQIPRVFEQLH